MNKNPNLPTMLHRYYAPTCRSISSFDSPYLWFSNLESMNDPFEGSYSIFHSEIDLTEGIVLAKKLFSYSSSRKIQPVAAEMLIRETLLKRPAEQRLNLVLDIFKEAHKAAMKRLSSQGFCCFFWV
ncbi:hypothetical protein [Pseudomonas japonica]|uniref:hypothetical protein n=1 Tax=Pseudomonas japonica TaxID=256466 RepID=UPI0015E2D2B0|nr:hypothetical protein [Pseudomonas japonica]MBA1288582.1 hypothetical protein [Pseudomonas japonica]